MSHQDHKRGQGHHPTTSEPGAGGQRSASSGKRTLAMSLPARTADALVPAAADESWPMTASRSSGELAPVPNVPLFGIPLRNDDAPAVMRAAAGTADAPAVMRAAAGTADAPVVDAGETFARATARAGGPVPYQQQMESVFGDDFSSVQSYTSRSAELQQLGARADSAR